MCEQRQPQVSDFHFGGTLVLGELATGDRMIL